jgi:integrase
VSVRLVTRRSRKTGAVRQYWMVDVVFEYPDGRIERHRKVSPVHSRRGAESFEQQLRASLLTRTFGRKEGEEEGEEVPEIPTLAQYEEQFIEYCEANKYKPSGIDSKKAALKNYLLPQFPNKRLNEFDEGDEVVLKKAMKELSPSTYNNAASILNSVLSAAKKSKVIEKVPYHFTLMKRQKGRPRFYDYDQYSWLVEAGQKLDRRIEIVVLLGGDAGLRRGEIIALEWPAVDLRRGLITVEQSEWKGKVTETKGMEYRVIPMTKGLREALQAHHHLRVERVLYTNEGETVTAKVLQRWMSKAQRRAHLRATGAIHILRHTFCSHLAMRGAPALAIQRLAGHQNLSTTLGYMHLADGEKERAIRLLDDRPLPTIKDGDTRDYCTNGETVETTVANDAGCVATAT